MSNGPSTLQEAIIFFADPENCRQFMVDLRWPDGKVKCPHCGSGDVEYLPNAKLFKCYQQHPRQKFSLKVGTIFEDSPIGLDKWLSVMWMLVNSKNGVSSWEIHRAMGVTQKSAWFMLQRGRLAMQDEGHGGRIGAGEAEVEVDETFIGGKARNMHKDRKARAQAHGRNTGGKTVVMGMLERGGTVRTAVIADRTKKTMQPIIRKNVETGAWVMSDEWASNWRMDDEYVHGVINHLEAYVNGNIHTNGMENFWSLLKRCIGGTYVSVEPYHLFRYVDEQAWRYNNRGRGMNDALRFRAIMRRIVGKRLTYAQLTGKEGETPEAF